MPKKYSVFSTGNKFSFTLEFYSDSTDPEVIRDKAREIARDFCNALNKMPGVYINFDGIDEVEQV